jgi:hypothetical protein
VRLEFARRRVRLDRSPGTTLPALAVAPLRSPKTRVLRSSLLGSAPRVPRTRAPCVSRPRLRRDVCPVVCAGGGENWFWSWFRKSTAMPGHTPLEARTGRSKQRYDGEVRLVAGCIPIRTSAEGVVQVCMISRMRGEGLIFPKARGPGTGLVARGRCPGVLRRRGTVGREAWWSRPVDAAPPAAGVPPPRLMPGRAGGAWRGRLPASRPVPLSPLC